MASAKDSVSNFKGGIAQLVERQLCKLDVGGSNPPASISKALRFQSSVFS